MTAERREPVESLPGDALQGWLHEARIGLVLNPEGGRELWLLLEVSVAASWGTEEFSMALRPMAGADPYVFAAELQGGADAIVRQAGRELQASEQAMREHRRRQRAESRRIREAATEAVVEASTCDYCQRPVRFVVEGARLCSRHAEELGVRPHGKVGEPEPDELPESTRPADDDRAGGRNTITRQAPGDLATPPVCTCQAEKGRSQAEVAELRERYGAKLHSPACPIGKADREAEA